MPKRYHYETDDDFVVDDSDVEVVPRPSKRQCQSITNSERTRTQHDAHSKSLEQRKKPTRYLNRAKEIKEAKVARNRSVQPREKDLLQELVDLTPWVGPMEKPEQLSDSVDESSFPQLHSSQSDNMLLIPSAHSPNNPKEGKTTSHGIPRDRPEQPRREVKCVTDSKKNKEPKITLDLSESKETTSPSPRSRKLNSTMKPRNPIRKDTKGPPINSQHRVNKNISPKRSSIKQLVRHEGIGVGDKMANLRNLQKGHREWKNTLRKSAIKDDNRPESVKTNKKLGAVNLLNLPAKLRNKVYEYLLEDEKEVTMKKHSSASDERPSVSNAAIASARFYSWGLAQTCKQLRSEYLPLLRRIRHVRVCLTQLNEYLNVFYPAEDTSKPHKRTFGKVEPTWYDSQLPEGIDVLALAKLVHASPDIKLLLNAPKDSVRCPEYHELSTMKLIIDSYPKWSQISCKILMRSIKITSREAKNRPLGYDRKVEIKCALRLVGDVGQRERERGISSWIFKSGMAKLEGFEFTCNNGGSHSWKVAPGSASQGPVVKYRFQLGGSGIGHGYRLKADDSSELGFVIRP